MSEQLVVNIEGQSSFELRLSKQRMRLGSDPGCELQIDHLEVPAVAATIDYRNGAYLLQNHCPYPVYLEQQTVAVEAWGMWRDGQRLQLTRGISLQLLSQGVNATSTDPATRRGDRATAVAELPQSGADQRRKMIQIGVIVACVVAAPILLTLEPNNETEATPQVSFERLMADLQSKPTPVNKVIRRRLQEAEQHLTNGKRDLAIRNFRYLVDMEPIRTAAIDGATLEADVKRFARDRLQQLSSP